MRDRPIEITRVMNDIRNAFVLSFFVFVLYAYEKKEKKKETKNTNVVTLHS